MGSETHFEDLTLGLVQRGVWSGHRGHPFTVKGAGRRLLLAGGPGGSDQALSEDICVPWVFTGDLVCSSRPTRGVPASCMDEKGALPGPAAAPRRGPGRGEERARGRVSPEGVCWAGSSRHPTTTHRCAGHEAGNVCWLKWGAVTMRCGCAPPGSQSQLAPWWARPVRGPGPLWPPRGRALTPSRGAPSLGPGVCAALRWSWEGRSLGLTPLAGCH